MTDSKAKIIGQALLQVNAIMKPGRLYGQDVWIDHSVIPLVRELLGQVIDRAQGKDIPIVIDMSKNKW